MIESRQDADSSTIKHLCAKMVVEVLEECGSDAMSSSHFAAQKDVAGNMAREELVLAWAFHSTISKDLDAADPQQ